jgi:acyl carrier protein
MSASGPAVWTCDQLAAYLATFLERPELSSPPFDLSLRTVHSLDSLDAVRILLFFDALGFDVPEEAMPNVDSIRDVHEVFMKHVDPENFDPALLLDLIALETDDAPRGAD